MRDASVCISTKLRTERQSWKQEEAAYTEQPWGSWSCWCEVSVWPCDTRGCGSARGPSWSGRWAVASVQTRRTDQCRRPRVSSARSPTASPHNSVSHSITA